MGTKRVRSGLAATLREVKSSKNDEGLPKTPATQLYSHQNCRLSLQLTRINARNSMRIINESNSLKSDAQVSDFLTVWGHFPHFTLLIKSNSWILTC